MISSTLFDFGGTLDADGRHWLDRFYTIYEQLGFDYLPKTSIKEAFYWAETQACADPKLKTSRYKEMVERHVHWQFEKLAIRDSSKEILASELFVAPAERTLRRNRALLENLKTAGLKLGIVSNNYGNMTVLCEEFGFLTFLDGVLDSACVGLSKPDLKIFALALDRLGVQARQTVFVGDSFDRDILPAKSLGMKTFWIQSDPEKPCPDSSKVDKRISSLEELPEALGLPQRAPT